MGGGEAGGEGWGCLLGLDVSLLLQQAVVQCTTAATVSLGERLLVLWQSESLPIKLLLSCADVTTGT